MTQELLLPIIALLGLTLWLALRHVFAVIQSEEQREIARSGASCQGKIVAIQRPFLLDACTRLYFDFLPEGGERPLRVCHVDRRPPAELRASLPVAGAVVTVRYLPQTPRRAVISKLVAVASSY
jgi:hypothetical protein